MSEAVVGSAEQLFVVEISGERKGAVVGCVGLVPLAGQFEAFAIGQQGLDFERFVVDFLIEDFQHFVVAGEGLLVLVVLSSVFGCLLEVLHGLVEHFSLFVVEGEVYEVVFQLAGVDFLDGHGDEQVQFAQAGAELHVVDGFAQQGVFEDVAQFVHRSPYLAFLCDADLLLENFGGVAVGPGESFLVFHHLGQHRHFEFAADDGCGFHGFADEGREAVEAGGEDGLDGVGQADVVVFDIPKAVLQFHEVAFGEIFEQLLQVEGVAVGGAL